MNIRMNVQFFELPVPRLSIGTYECPVIYLGYNEECH